MPSKNAKIFSMTDESVSRLQDLAKIHGCSLSEMVRRCILDYSANEEELIEAQISNKLRERTELAEKLKELETEVVELEGKRNQIMQMNLEMKALVPQLMTDAKRVFMSNRANIPAKSEVRRIVRRLMKDEPAFIQLREQSVPEEEIVAFLVGERVEVTR